MTTLLKRESLLPTWTNELFDTGRFMSPRFADFDGDYFPMEFGKHVPSVNITESEKVFRIDMAVPGMNKKDFKVVTENGMLFISSEKEEKFEEATKNFTRKEYSYSNFKRTFSLPQNCISDKIDAKYENGILYISLPKKEVSPTIPAHTVKVS